jgi:hypothetical protein
MRSHLLTMKTDINDFAPDALAAVRQNNPENAALDLVANPLVETLWKDVFDELNRLQGEDPIDREALAKQVAILRSKLEKLKAFI